MLIVCGTIYVLNADADLQVWNDPNHKKKKRLAEKEVNDVKINDKDKHTIM